MANLLQKASIVLTPTAYDNGKVLCAKPSEPPYGDFDFSRNSAATRVNAQGLVENVQILSSNLVQNGDFSEEGVQEVSNGSFSQEGSELVVNGDFATDSDWTADYGASQSDITISNGELSFISSATYGFAKQQINVTSGKIYKITADIKSFSGSMRLFSSSGNAAKTINSTGIITNYFTPIDATTLIGFSANNDIGASVVCNSISCVEVGQNWILGTGWSIAENKAVANTTGSTNGLLQTSAITSGKIYKATFEVLDYQGGSVRINLGGAGLTGVGNLVSANGVYTQYITSDGVDVYMQGRVGFNGSITNISVKEVGQNWTLGDSWEIGSSKATRVTSVDWGLDQAISSAVNGRTYRVTTEITDYTSGILRLALGSGGTVNAIGTGLGVYVNDFVWDGTSGTIIRYQGSFVGSISNISVIEITDDTNLPRINYEGFSYQDALGSEEVVNGTFDTDSDWVKGTGWSISGGTANCDGTQTSNSNLLQSNTAISGNTYKITYTITNYVSGTLKSVLGVGGVVRNSNGVYSEYITATSSSFLLQANSDFIGSIDNVSVKEYLGQSVVPDSGCGSYLFEPASTNLVPYSNDLNTTANAAINGSSTITLNYAASPSGENDAQRLEATSGTANGDYALRGFNPTTPPNLDYTHSVWLKSNNGNTQNAIFYGRAVQGPQAVCVVTDQWQRFEFTGDSVTGNYFAYLGVRPEYGSDATIDVLVWGAQVEQQSYATSYIPTENNPNGVSRNQDLCTNGGSLASINSTEGTLYGEIAALADGVNGRYISIGDGTLSNYVYFRITGVLNQIKMGVIKGGLTQASKEFVVSDLTQFNKLALSYSQDLFKFYVNGALIFTDTNGDIFPVGTLNTLTFNNANTANYFLGKTKALAVWKEALSDQELADLTYPTPTDPTFALDFDTIATDFTFARGSEATYVDAQGLIKSTNEIGPELVTNGDFATDTDWIKGSGATIGGGKANLDGSLSSSYADALRQVSILTVGKTYKFTYTVSNYVSGGAKFFGNNSVEFSANGTYTEYITATIPNVSLQDRAIPITCSIDNVSVKEYITATNTPRLDYSTGAEAFLLEPASTNLITYSEDFSNAIWAGAATSATITASTNINPSGGSGTYLVENVTGTQLGAVASVTAGLSYTGSFYVRNVSGSGAITLRDVNSVTTAFTATDEWQRFSVTGVATGPGRLYINVLTTGDVIEVWGAQLETSNGLGTFDGSYATSYIPTEGSSVSRNQETCINATPEINSEEGVLYAEIAALSDDLTFRSISLNDGTNTNSVGIRYRTNSNRVNAIIKDGNGVALQMNVDISDITQFNKIALRYKSGDVSMYINGTEVATNSLSFSFTGALNDLSFDRGDNNDKFFGNTKDVQVYTKALSDAELIKLTT